MSFRSGLRLCLILLTGLTMVTLAKAQSATGAISGTVTDPNGLAAVDAAVVVKNVDTGVESTLTTNNAGLYAAPYLQPGHYDVTISKSGFNTVVFQKIAVHVGDTVTLDTRLPLQTQQSSVTVTDEDPLLETSKTSQEQVVSETQIDGLPLSARGSSIAVWRALRLLAGAIL